jgi:CxxC motif-containing protein
MAHKEMTCISCPRGCRLDVEYGDSIISVKNNGCKVGIKYANDEIFDPRRIVTTTVKTNLAIAFLPVKTSKAIPKNLVKNVIGELKDITVSSPVQIGDVIKKNICGTDADIVAARNILA